ncbi:MAG: murein L,D-transpeptidase catalytic domain family protein [Sphingobacteriaceae bacterium]|nr:murein L,D-transpeptidase catalytic domain family protein [Sphingobacteriaceae bacterium]
MYLKISIASLCTVLLVSLGFRGVPASETVRSEQSADSLQLMSQWLYAQPEMAAKQLSFPLFEKAVRGYFALQASGAVAKPYLSIIDFSLPSSQERLWVFDLKNRRLLHSSLVAHGRNSGELFAENFSNKASSFQSSLGFYVTGDTYIGKHGLSLYLDGQEAGINEKARERYIVMHGAEYVSQEFVAQHGRLGRSLGCPAIPMADHERLINLLAGKSCLFIYHPQHSSSTLLEQSLSPHQIWAWLGSDAPSLPDATALVQLAP